MGWYASLAALRCALAVQTTWSRARFMLACAPIGRALASHAISREAVWIRGVRR